LTSSDGEFATGPDGVFRRIALRRVVRENQPVQLAQLTSDQDKQLVGPHARCSENPSVLLMPDAAEYRKHPVRDAE